MSTGCICLRTCTLKVTGPFQQEVSQTLRLKNPHSDPVAFKVSLHYSTTILRTP